MAHELTIRKNGKAEMAYVGAKPWHNLGQELAAGADLETWKEAAGMDWNILSGPVKFNSDGLFPAYNVLYRSDDHAPLSIVSSKYKVVQPGEVLEFFKDLVGANGFELTTAGTLFGGKRFWALASIGQEACVVGKDKVGGYLLLSSSCDGTLATTARFTTVRVVCNNTLSMALGTQAEVTVGHRSHFNPAAVKDQLGIARDTFADFMKSMRSLAKVKLSDVEAGALVGQLLTETKTVYKEDVAQSRQYKQIMGLFDGQGIGADLAGASGTAWGLVNAVTEYVDHHARAKTDSARLASAWFGRGDSLKTEAAQRLLALV